MTRHLTTVKPESEPAVQAHWDRQRKTAAHILDRFERDDHDVQLLGDEVGMGKTYVALAVIAEHLLRPENESPRALLVTPASSVLRTKWEQEIRSFGENYVVPTTRKLQPLQLNSYWDLVANLHDYKSLSKKYVTPERERCLLEATWQWFLARKLSSDGKRLRSPWPPLENAWKKPEAKETEMVRFVSEFSMAAWHAFLDDRNANERGAIVEMLGRGGAMWSADPDPALRKLKDLFREFVTRQDDYEPNVFIISMNALGMPKRNSWGTRRFATFVLATLLSRRHEETCKRCLKGMKNEEILLEKVSFRMLREMANLDLFNTRHCVLPALKANPELARRWEAILDASADNIPATFKAILSAVIAQKIAESGIGLAVVDEVHNWKGNTNGASDFRAGFAPHVRRKLIMSATPFQLEEREMQRVFENVARPDGKTWRTLQSLYGSTIVADCLAANAALLQALKALGSQASTDEVLAQLDVAPERITARLGAIALDRSSSEAALSFCRAALDYRAAVDRLEDSQRKLVVRHLKADARRSFHAGADFGRVAPVHRPSLYPTPGLSHPDDQLVNYLAMRLDQRMRRDGSSAKAKAHLLGGMTSSLAAFKASAQATRSRPGAATSTETMRYAEMVEAVLDQHLHPKVEATVAHALRNYRNGQKTLIFCERVATVDEIIGKIVAGLGEDVSAASGQDGAAGDVREREAFVDVPFARLLDPGIDAVPAAVATFVADSLQASGLEPTPRRMLRLANWYLLSKSRADSTPSLQVMAARLVGLFDRGELVETLKSDVLGGKGGAPFTGELSDRVGAFVEAQFSGALNLWVDAETPHPGPLHHALVVLLESEARLALAADKGDDQPKVTIGFAKTLLDLERGLKTVLLRPDLLRGIDARGDALDASVHARVRTPLGQGESSWHRMTRFVSQLASANGSINVDDQKSTDRKSLWRAVSLRGVRTDAATPGATEPLVQKLTGATDAAARVAVCAAFNSPLAPDILVCTSIGSEGIDLHRECAEIIHHDMPWNPARLEQRNGRIDRVNSLSKATGRHVRVGVPFLEQGYERFQFERLLSRAQLFQVLLGRLDFDATDVDRDSDDDTLPELDPDGTADDTIPQVLLPESLARWLSVDLSVWTAPETAQPG